MGIILGCDPAANFGWAILDGEQYIDGGTETFSYPTDSQIRKKGRFKGEKWLNASLWFDKMLEERKPDLIVYEDVMQFTSRLNTQSFGYFRYTIEGLAAKHKIKTVSFKPSEWRKLGFDKGNISKADTAIVLLERYPGITFVTEDHSDALGVAVAGAKYLAANQSV